MYGIWKPPEHLASLHNADAASALEASSSLEDAVPAATAASADFVTILSESTATGLFATKICLPLVRTVPGAAEG